MDKLALTVAAAMPTQCSHGRKWDEQCDDCAMVWHKQMLSVFDKQAEQHRAAINAIHARHRAEISYRDATIRDQADRLRCAAGGVQCERLVNEVQS